MSDTKNSDAQQLRTFRDEGLLVLPNAIPATAVATLKRHFWYEVGETFAIREQDRKTWFTNPANPAGGSRGRRLAAMNPVLNRLRDAGHLSAAQASIEDTVASIFGPDHWEPLEKWYSLLSFPGDDDRWTVPHNSWHNDEPTVVGDPEPWSIFAFVFLDTVRCENGPTLAITGSHRRSESFASEQGVSDERQVRAFDHGLTQDPSTLRLLNVGELLPALTATDEWFAELVDPTGEPGRSERLMENGTEQDGIKSRVVALAGQAGDVILFDPRCLHTVSANISEHPRQILRLDFRRTRSR